ncbi:coiled-coil domain-containing protein 73 [Menidia menidia]
METLAAHADFGDSVMEPAPPGGGVVSLQLLEFKSHLLEVVEELHIRREAEARHEDQISRLVLERQELEWEKESLQNQLETVTKQHTESITAVQRQFQAKLRNVEEEKGKHQVTAELKDKEINSLKEEVKSLQLLKYNLEKTSGELEQKLALQSRTKDTHLVQLGEVEKRFGSLSRQSAAVKQAHDKLQQDVDEAMKINQKLTSANQRQEATIVSLKKDLDEVSNKLIKAKMASFTQVETPGPAWREQRLQELQQKLGLETEMNHKLREENAAERAEKQELMKSLQHVQQLLLSQTQTVRRVELELQSQTETFQALKREHEAMRERSKAEEEQAARLMEAHEASRSAWDKERTALLDRVRTEQEAAAALKETPEQIPPQSEPQDQEREMSKQVGDSRVSARLVEDFRGKETPNESVSSSDLDSGCRPQTRNPDGLENTEAGGSEVRRDDPADSLTCSFNRCENAETATESNPNAVIPSGNEEDSQDKAKHREGDGHLEETELGKEEEDGMGREQEETDQQSQKQEDASFERNSGETKAQRAIQEDPEGSVERPEEPEGTSEPKPGTEDGAEAGGGKEGAQTEEKASETQQTKTQTEEKASEKQQTQTQTEEKASEKQQTQTQTEEKASETQQTQTQTEEKASETQQTKTQTEEKASEKQQTQTQTEEKASEKQQTQTQTEEKASETQQTQTQTEEKASEKQQTQTQTEKSPAQQVTFPLEAGGSEEDTKGETEGMRALGKWDESQTGSASFQAPKSPNQSPTDGGSEENGGGASAQEMLRSGGADLATQSDANRRESNPPESEPIPLISKSASGFTEPTELESKPAQNADAEAAEGETEVVVSANSGPENGEASKAAVVEPTPSCRKGQRSPFEGGVSPGSSSRAASDRPSQDACGQNPDGFQGPPTVTWPTFIRTSKAPSPLTSPPSADSSRRGKQTEAREETAGKRDWEASLCFGSYPGPSSSSIGGRLPWTTIPGRAPAAGASLEREEQQSSFRAQISKIEQFLSAERLRLPKRRRTDN